VVPEEEPNTFDAEPKYPTLDLSPSSDHQNLILVQNQERLGSPARKSRQNFFSRHRNQGNGMVVTQNYSKNTEESSQVATPSHEN